MIYFHSFFLQQRESSAEKLKIKKINVVPKSLYPIFMLTLHRIIQSLFVLCQAVKKSPLKSVNNKLLNYIQITTFISFCKDYYFKEKNVMKYFLQHVLITLNQINILPPINVSINIVYLCIGGKTQCTKNVMLSFR